MGVGAQCHAPPALPQGKTWYPLCRRLGRPQVWSGWVWKISPPPGFDPQTVQPVASCYADWAILAHIIALLLLLLQMVYTGWQCAAVQDRTIQYSTVHTSCTITCNTQGNPLSSISWKNLEHVLYSIKTQKWGEPKVDESVYKNTSYTKQWVNQYSVTYISPRPTPHSSSLTLYTLHILPHLNSLPFTAFSWSSPHFNYLHFISLFTSQALFLEIFNFLCT
jgi:hypothetical protein